MNDKNVLVNFEATFFTEFALSKMRKKTFSITSKYFKYSHLRLMNEQTQIIYTAHVHDELSSRPDHHKRLTLKMMWKSAKISSGNRKLVLFDFIIFYLRRSFFRLF